MRGGHKRDANARRTMPIQYQAIFGHRYNGTLSSGPNAGRTLVNECLDFSWVDELNGYATQEWVISEAERRKVSNPNVVIEVYSKVFVPKGRKGGEFKETILARY